MRHLILRQKMANSHLISYSKIPGKTLLFAVNYFFVYLAIYTVIKRTQAVKLATLYKKTEQFECYAAYLLCIVTGTSLLV